MVVASEIGLLCRENGVLSRENGVLGRENGVMSRDYRLKNRENEVDKRRINDGKLVNPNFSYSSNINNEWMSTNELKIWIKDNIHLINNI